MRKAIYNHIHGAGGSWEGQVIEVDEESETSGPVFHTYFAYLDGQKGRVYEEELTWLGKYVVEDWMGNRVFPAETFDTFEEARERISEVARLEAEEEGPEGSDAYEDTYNGVCDDLYAVLKYED